MIFRKIWSDKKWGSEEKIWKCLTLHYEWPQFAETELSSDLVDKLFWPGPKSNKKAAILNRL